MAVDALDRVRRRVRRRELTIVTLLVCELCLLTLNARAAALQTLNPLDRILPADSLKPVEASADQFNAPAPLRFRLKGAQFDRTVADVILSINGECVTGRHIRISSHQLTTDVQLTDGANLVSLKAYDTVGRTLYYNATLWSGNWTLRVDLVGPDGAAVQSVCTVVVSVPGDDTVRQEQMTNRGSATFKNLPAHKVIVNAHATDGVSGTTEIFGSAGSVRLVLQKSST